jgi:hypothetical protein
MNLRPQQRTTNECSPQRRRLLRSLSMGALGMSMPEWLTLEVRASYGSDARLPGQAKRVLVIYEEGGISQMDSFDPKPDALIDHRSPFKPIPTSVPGTHFSSLMPLTAKIAHRLSVVRSMTSAPTAGHPECCKEFFKGWRNTNAFEPPDIGSVVTQLLGTERKELPGYIFCPGINMPNAVTSTGFLPPSRAPWKLGTKQLGEDLSDPKWKVRSLEPLPGLPRERIMERHRLMESLDTSDVAKASAAEVMKANTQHALDLLTSPEAQRAFDLNKESDAMRDRYGRDHRGCCYLLGRRLIESGVRFVTVTCIQPPEHVKRPGYGQPGGVFLNWDQQERWSRSLGARDVDRVRRCGLSRRSAHRQDRPRRWRCDRCALHALRLRRNDLPQTRLQR